MNPQGSVSFYLSLTTIAVISLQPSQLVMSDLNSFHRFSSLPAEIRLNIYKCATPRRILQLGIDFPFPFLPPADSNEDCLWPVPCLQPALFAVCHESRIFCLSEYIPFAYSYLHPSLDTLYISRKAATRLFVNSFRDLGTIRAPLYPMALIDRMIIELNVGDLPRVLRPSSSSVEFNTYVHAIEMFGPPKELLVVGSHPWNEPSHSAIAGWEGLEIWEDLEDWLPSDSEEQVLNFAQKTLQMDAKYNPWLAWRVPKVTIAKVKRSGRFNREKDIATEKILNVITTTAQQWQQDEWAVKHRTWDWDKDGSPYCLENMKSALAKYKQKAV